MGKERANMPEVLLTGVGVRFRTIRLFAFGHLYEKTNTSLRIPNYIRLTHK